MPRIGDRPGLQAERTILSWDRTAVGFVANGALVAVRHIDAVPPAQLAVAAVALLLAVSCTGARRQRTAAPRPATSTTPPPRRQVYFVTCGVLLLALAVLVSIVVDAVE